MTLNVPVHVAIMNLLSLFFSSSFFFGGGGGGEKGNNKREGELKTTTTTTTNKNNNKTHKCINLRSVISIIQRTEYPKRDV